MADINPSIPTSGEVNSTADPKIRTALNTLIATINDLGEANFADGAVTADKIAAAAAEDVGLSQTGYVRRGATEIAGSEARANTAYGKLATPDEVSNVVLPSAGLIFVVYHALWQESVVGAARAAIFVESTQLNTASIDSAAAAQEARTNVSSGTGKNLPLISCPGGLMSNPNTGAFAPSSNATESLPQIAGGVDPRIAGYSFQPYGGVCAIMAAAGTYDVSVQFKATSGTVTASKRHLWVWTLGF